MQIYRKNLIDSFSRQIKEDYYNFCDRQELKKGDDTLLDFLLSKNLVGEVAVRRYIINKDFNKLIEIKRDKTKTEIVRLLSERYQLSERSVWNIIK